ncbi:MAG TPA: oligosaccharide flippase family protein [Ktedonobacteraceae bacterium]|jgi:O-antigen/teichoic acid export membrane protein|nr:oligosaccharide flippase family protein [Ktedonobacteraceae bacterium]
MVNQLEQLPKDQSHKRLHRLRLRPLAELEDDDITLKVPRIGKSKWPQNIITPPLPDLLTPSLPALEPWEVQQLQFIPEQAGAEGESFADDPDLEKFATIPMVVLDGISKQQGTATPVMVSEITGAASNASVVGLGNIAGYVFKYANNLLIQRGLHASFFGLYSLSMSVVTLVSSIFDLGMDNAMIRYMAIYRGKKQTHLLRTLTIFCTALVGITGILGGLLVLFFATPLAALQNKPDIAPFLQFMAPLVPLLCLQTVWLGGLQGLKEFKQRVLIQRFVIPLSTFLLMLIAILFFRDITGIVVVTFLGVLLTDVINLYFLFRAVSRLTKADMVEEETYQAREWMGFAVPNFLTTIISTVLDSVDTLLLAFYVPAAAIGQYAAGLKITGFISMPLSTINVIFTPTIAELYAKKEMQKLSAMFKIMTKWSVALCLPIFGITVIFATPLLEISGRDFVSGAGILIVLAIGDILTVAGGSGGYMLLMTGHQKVSVFNSLAVVVLNVVLGIVLTQHYGAFGTAISTSAALIAINGARVVEIQLLLKMHPYRLDMLKPLGAGLISGLVTAMLLFLLNKVIASNSFLSTQFPIQLILVPVFLAAYVTLLVLFKIDPEDRIIVDRLLKKVPFGKSKRAD